MAKAPKMLLPLLLLHAALTRAFCTEIALWVPWKDDTVDKVASVLHLENYQTLVELNHGLDVGYIQRGESYTVPYTSVDPPATWVTVDECTHLLLLTAASVASPSARTTSGAVKTPARSTLETRARNTGKETNSDMASLKTSGTSETLLTQTSRAKGPEKASSDGSGDSTTGLDGSSPTPRATTTDLSTAVQEGTKTATHLVTTALTPSGARTITATETTTLTVTKATVTTITKTDTEAVTKTVTEDHSTCASSASSVSSLVCHPDGSQSPGGSHYTGEEKLDTYARQFCEEVKDVSLSENFESVQIIYGGSKEMYIFTVSWVPGCDGDEQSVSEAGEVCYNTLVANWKDCNNRGQGGGKRSGCVVWTYRPGAINDD
ncbi:hypothetical protein BGZ63DRAFT_379512 [Mariannaea sp. PMI_226]|nr:hypothetical protein BGZ63DRAFT_379512 [Mariannaea sp. PMI_226]